MNGIQDRSSGSGTPTRHTTWSLLACLFALVCASVAWGNQELRASANEPRSGEAEDRSTATAAAAEDLPDAGASPKADTAVPRFEPTSLRILRLDGGIFGGTADYLIRNIEEAERRQEPVLILLDTPGGALEATRDIVKAFMSAKVPVIVWVGPAGARAGSAGVFITMAAHIAVMAPGTNIGAAHPVGGGFGAPGEDEAEQEENGTPSAKKRRARDEQEVMAQKIENDTLAFIESIAKERKRNVEWALSAVKDSVSITADKAQALNVIDFLAKDLDAVLAGASGREVETSQGRVLLDLSKAQRVEVEMSLRQQVLTFLSDPNLVYILFVVGMLGLYLEFNHPGMIVPGVAGAVSLLLALTGLSVLPYSVSGILFLLVGGACFIAETYVTSMGLLSVAGAAALVLGAILLFEAPSGAEDLPGLAIAVSPTVYGTVALASLLVVLPVALLVARAQLRPSLSGRDALIGLEGEALTDVDTQHGKVFVRGEYWDAHATACIARGTPVRVTAVNGLLLQVIPIGEVVKQDGLPKPEGAV